MTRLLRQRGFTLMEMLVVLVLAGLVAVLLTQGVSQLLMLRERILEHTQFQRENILRRAWFADSIQHLIPDLPRLEQHLFRGDAKSFEGLSLSPLLEFSGVPVTFNWSLVPEQDVWHLYYQEAEGVALRVWSWRADTAFFSYFDAETGWVAEWPPSSESAGLLPQAVLLGTEWRGAPLSWVASVAGSRSPRPDLMLPEEFL